MTKTKVDAPVRRRTQLEVAQEMFQKRLRVFNVIREYETREHVDPDSSREIDTTTLRKSLDMKVGEMHGHLEYMRNKRWVTSRLELRKLGPLGDGKSKRPCKVWKTTGVVPELELTQETGSVKFEEGSLSILLNWIGMPSIPDLCVVASRVYNERHFLHMQEKHSLNPLEQPT